MPILDNTIGAVFLGTSASSLLFGLAIVQTRLYYHNFPKDWTFQKVSVAVLMTLATSHLLFILHAVYFYLIVNFGRLAALESIVWSFKLQLLINHDGYLSSKLIRYESVETRETVLAILARSRCVHLAGGWAVGIFAMVNSYERKYFTDLDSMRRIIYAAPAIATSVDVILATALCYYLRRSRSAFVGGTNNKILIIMRYNAENNNGSHSACSLSALITASEDIPSLEAFLTGHICSLQYAIIPRTLVFAAIELLLPHLYVNSYLSMLNARMSINKRDTFTLDVNKASVGSAVNPRTDDGNIGSMNSKIGSIGLGLSPTKFMSSQKRASDPHGKRGTLERHSGVLPVWAPRPTRLGNAHESEDGCPEQPGQPGDACSECKLSESLSQYQDEACAV
ncbi:hypothetical protein M413DRAFT_30246 [Hebeloma cylindrosporum]|uniref:DUF6534 domain-containing protein n=1 Tax=Hebeloma cylindrosporum TaxID=76867 RepID=A0A0C2XKY8_HEBCY|nr:hypothetical protein M413DRAFT_30246 [Hebeloma cylindrosporum h7]